MAKRRITKKVRFNVLSAIGRAGMSDDPELLEESERDLTLWLSRQLSAERTWYWNYREVEYLELNEDL
jgi:hypothetical protein